METTSNSLPLPVGLPRFTAVWGASVMPRLKSAWRALYRRRAVAVASVGLLTMALCALNSFVLWPYPEIHDEFCYLLQADTFVRGRLTNPTHPHWHHFETFHQIHEPTYMAKYPPAQGLALAFGQWVFGYPAIGVWITTALASAAFCWMLQGWMSPRWALFGGLIVAVHPTVQLIWGNGYWGGSVAMTGGALMFGAVIRLYRRVRLGDSIAMAVGVAILANSRPFEGFVASIPVAVAVLWRLLGPRRPPLWDGCLKVILPTALVLGVVGAGMAYYNLRITGSPLKLPYRVHEETYATAPTFLWQPLIEDKTYRHDEIRRYWCESQIQLYQLQRTVWQTLRKKVATLSFYMRPLFWFGVLGLPFVVRNRKYALAAALVVTAFAVSSNVLTMFTHYLAPIAPLMLMLMIRGVAHWQSKRTRQSQLSVPARLGRTVAIVLVVGHILSYPLAVYSLSCKVPLTWVRARTEVIRRLEQTPGKHLVFVKYSPNHNVHHEWVFNGADIDGSKLVWARIINPEEDQKLCDYFSDRSIWLIHADDESPELVSLPRRNGFTNHYLPAELPASDREVPG